MILFPQVGTLNGPLANGIQNIGLALYTNAVSFDQLPALGAE